MVKVTLNYNPYTLETDITFNGDKPRINSLVEKYLKQPLQLWINSVPEIFYDEMNGYDFDLIFSGTELDFEELKKAFKRAKVSEDEVEFFHQDILGDRKAKIDGIDQLLDWLKQNPNERFDNETFRKENEDIFDNPYTYIIIDDGTADTDEIDNKEFAVERVTNSKELDNAYLLYVPIVYCIDQNNMNDFHNDLMVLLKNPNVDKNQLFFLLEGNLNDQSIIRVIKDLGIEEPQIVNSFNDDRITKYVNIYPICDYIYNAIQITEETVLSIKEKLDEEIRINNIQNREVYEKLNQLEMYLNGLQQAKDNFIKKPNLREPNEFGYEKSNLSESISNWKIRRNKIMSLQEATEQANMFDLDIENYYSKFFNNIHETTYLTKDCISREFQDWYFNSGVKDGFSANDQGWQRVEPNKVPRYASEFIELKIEEMVNPKEGFFSAFKQRTEPLEKVKETTWYFYTWRKFADEKISEIAANELEKHYAVLQEYYNSLSDEYLLHINQKIEQFEKEKAELSAQLSDKERLLQIDNDWVKQFIQQLDHIKRG